MILVWVGFPPRENFIKLNTDGAFNLATGTTSTGGLLRDHCGAWLGGFHRNMAANSSLMAEIWALRDDLALAKDRNVHNLEIEMLWVFYNS